MPTLEQLDAAMARAWLHVPAVQQLGGGDIASNDAQQRPWRVVGSDAVVYQLRQRDGNRLALRCPLSDTFNDAHAVRYRAMASDRDKTLECDWLARVIAYFADGLMLTRKGFRSEPHPVIAMEWIEGPTLLDTVQQACSTGHHQALATLAHEWRSLVGQMEDIGFVHGDLNAENPLVGSHGRIKLVDLDTSAWPGSPPAPIGFGTPGFVHPRANPHMHGSHRDAFAALVVFVSLRALAVRPELWNRALARRGRSRHDLLFSAWDLAHPRSSPIFAELQQIDDQQARAGVSALAAACDGSPDMVPRFGGARGAASPEFPPGTGVGVERDQMVATKRHRWEAGEYQPPARRAALSNSEREDRAELVRRFQAAVESEDGEAVARLWPAVRGDRRVSALAILAADILQRRFGKMIADALRAGDDRAIVASVQAAERAGVPVTASTRRTARTAARRLNLRERLGAAARAGDHRAISAIALSPELDELGPLDDATSRVIGHALAVSDIERSVRVGDDAEVAAIVRSDERLDVSRLDEAMRARIELAIQRVAWVERVRSALRKRDVQALEAAFRDDPGSARDPLSKVERARAERMIERERAVRRLNRALADGSDDAVLEAMNELMASGAALPDSIEWGKVRNAVDRTVLIEALREATRASPPDHSRLARLVPAARSLSRHTPALATEFDLDELERIVLRETHRERLRDALAEEDDEAIMAAAFPDSFGIVASLSPEQRARVERAAVRRR